MTRRRSDSRQGANSADAPPPQCLVGLIGSGIQASKSPALHEAEAAAQGFRCRYELIDLDQLGVGAEHLPDLLADAERRGFSGLNITYPCKQAVIPFLSGLSVQAQTIGAVNTVQFSNGQRIGYNTDAWGFAESFRLDMTDAPVSVVTQVGAGGAGAATAYALLELGTQELRISDLDMGRASALAAVLAQRYHDRNVRAWSNLAEAVSGADGIVNATPMGMARHPGTAVPVKLLRPDFWVADIVYFPLDTVLLQAARAAGCRVLDGGGMAVYQAVRAFEIFTGRPANSKRMRQHFLRLLHQ